MGEKNYVNPAADGGWVAPHGDRPSPKINPGSKQGSYDNAPNTSKTSTDGGTAKPAGRSAPSSGRDDAGINGDFGFSGNPKKRSPKI